MSSSSSQEDLRAKSARAAGRLVELEGLWEENTRLANDLSEASANKGVGLD